MFAVSSHAINTLVDETIAEIIIMPRHLTQDRLRSELLDIPGQPIQEYNRSIHQQARELVALINEEYILIRRAMLMADQKRYSVGLILAYDSQTERHTGLEIGYIRWRYGRFSLNKRQKNTGSTPLTNRVSKRARGQLHYMIHDFSSVPLWSSAPEWEHRLVMAAELKARPIREALREHEKSQRAYLYSRSLPEVDRVFEGFD